MGDGTSLRDMDQFANALVRPGRVGVRRLAVWGGIGCVGVVFCVFAAWLLGGVTAFCNSRAAAALANRDYESAEVWLSRASGLLSVDGRTMFLEARLARKELRLSEVPELLRRAMEMGFDPELARREFLLLEAQAGQLAKVRDELNLLLMQDVPDGTEICEAYVNGAVMSGGIDLALTIIESWKQAAPSDPQPFYALARILEYQQRTEEALAELAAAIALNARHWPSLYARSRLLSGLGDQERALADAVAATAMRWNAAAKLQQARCLLNLARPAEARGLLGEILELPPGALQRSFNLVCEPERGLPVQAELGYAEAALGNSAAAVGWFEQVLERDPNHLNVRYQRALALRELDRAAEAESELSEVQKIREQLREIDGLADVIRGDSANPRLAERCRIGELFLRYEDARRGEFWLLDTLNHDPTYAPAHRLLAEYYDRLAADEPGYRVMAERHRRALGERVEGTTNDAKGEFGERGVVE